MSRNARRRGSSRRIRADATDRLVALALARPEHERSSAAYTNLCEMLRPFVDANVLDRDEAAKAAHDAVMAADAELVARPRMRGAA